MPELEPSRSGLPIKATGTVLARRRTMPGLPIVDAVLAEPGTWPAEVVHAAAADAPTGRSAACVRPVHRGGPRRLGSLVRVLPAAAAALCSSCSAAPALNIAGSFFPAWLLCLVLGGVAAGVMRAVLGAVGLSDKLLFPPLTYLAILVGVALAIWLLVFGS